MAFYRGGNKNFFLEQWQRVIRWKNKCVPEKKVDEKELPDTLDYYFAFFMNAYHLRDWIIAWAEENNRHDLIVKLNNDFETNQSLKILRDICNAPKHFELTNPSVGKQFATPLAYFSEGKIEYMILIGGHQDTLSNLTKKITAYWEDFMHNNGLENLTHDISGPLIPFD